jgi:hypothetical protein
MLFFCRHLLVSMLLPSVCILSILCLDTHAEELELINRPANTSGLTGLLLTTSPFTIAPGSIELGFAAISEKSATPGYSLNELPLVTIQYGMTETMELALKGSYFHETTDAGIRQRSAGDTQLSYKWNFLPQNKSSSLPALALILTGIAATGKREANFEGVSHWGAKFGLATGREIAWGDHIVGLYADAQVVVHDQSDGRSRDSYGVMNAGLIFPISKYRNLQMLLEYTIVNGVDKVTQEGGDYSAITYGLRMVTERFNLSIGTQFLRKDVEGFDNSTRIIGMTSIKF